MSRQATNKAQGSNPGTSGGVTGTSNLRVAPSELHYGVRVSQPFSAGPARGAASLVIYNHDLPQVFERDEWFADTETDGLEARRDKLRLFTLCDNNGNLILVRNPDHMSRNLIYTIDFKNITFHHAAFDTSHILWWMNLGFDPYAVDCTKVMAKATGRFEHSGLNYLVREVLGEELAKSKDITLSNWNAKQLSAAQIEYACSDVLYLEELRNELGKKLAKLDRGGLWSEACAAAVTKAYVDLKGYGDVLSYDGVPNEKLRKLWEKRHKGMALDIALNKKKRSA